MKKNNRRGSQEFSWKSRGAAVHIAQKTFESDVEIGVFLYLRKKNIDNIIAATHLKELGQKATKETSIAALCHH